MAQQPPIGRRARIAAQSGASDPRLRRNATTEVASSTLYGPGLSVRAQKLTLNLGDGLYIDNAGRLQIDVEWVRSQIGL